MATQIQRITSRQNARFKQWKEYVSHPEQVACPWLPVEGWKQATELSEQRPIELLLFSDSGDPRLRPLLATSRESICLPARLLAEIASVETSQGLVAFFKKPAWSWEQLGPFLLFLYRLQDPGNLGTLLRTAQATGCFGLLTSPASVSCFNAKVVRASATALFSVPLLEGVDSASLKDRGYQLLVATLREGPSLFEARLNPPLAVAIGNEGSGLDAEVLDEADAKLHIPMDPVAESLNAGVAGSLILYEVYRRGLQR